jgi:ATP-dependent RNA helicase DHX37/DHR1
VQIRHHPVSCAWKDPWNSSDPATDPNEQKLREEAAAGSGLKRPLELGADGFLPLQIRLRCHFRTPRPCLLHLHLHLPHPSQSLPMPKKKPVPAPVKADVAWEGFDSDEEDEDEDEEDMDEESGSDIEDGSEEEDTSSEGTSGESESKPSHATSAFTGAGTGFFFGARFRFFRTGNPP